MIARRLACPAAFAAAMALFAGCALPPPPGAFVEVAVVRPSEIPASRPLVAVPVRWDALLHGTAPAQDCGIERCASDPGGWHARCLAPRATDAARQIRSRLLAGDRWHAAALASLAGVPADHGPALPPLCDEDRLLQQAAAAIVRAVGELAATEATAACPALALRRVVFGLYEIDRSKESFGEWLRYDYPSVVGGSFLGILTGAVAMPAGDILSRVATLELALARSGPGRAQLPDLELAVRGGASVRIASGKVLDASNPPPAELVPVALGDAIGELSRALRAFADAGC